MASTNYVPNAFPEIKFDTIKLGQQIGRGSFGSVHVGTWFITEEIQKIVALKKVFVLEKEAEILSKIRHRNIIEFYGISNTNSNVYILTEYAENGSLYDYLHKIDSPKNDFVRILEWATQISSALVYLHYEAVTTIIHRDLKSRNVVLDAKFACKICDFGTSKDLTQSFASNSWVGTAAWMSPELIKQSEKITIATDVWSYGVVLWEMLSHEVPFKDFSEFQVYTQISEQGITLAIPEQCPIPLKEILYGCWKMVPKERFSMKIIKEKLEAMARSTNLQEQCQTFLDRENWSEVINGQKEEIQKLKKALEKNKELLHAKDRALRKKSQETAIREVLGKAPENVALWTEHDTARWIKDILEKKLEEDELNIITENVMKHRITGNRLLIMDEKELEKLALTKIGSRIEIQKNLRELIGNHQRALNFPSLHEAAIIDKTTKLGRDPLNMRRTSTHDITLLLGFTTWSTGKVIRFKFYIDSDWKHADETTNQPTYKMIKSACFSVYDCKTNNLLNEPECHLCTSPMISMNWLTKDSNIESVRVIANAQFADAVCEPRSAEMLAIVSFMEKNQIVVERPVQLRLGHRNKGSFSSSPGGSQRSHLRGAWQKKASESKHELYEDELSNLRIPLITPPSSAEPLTPTNSNPNIFRPLSNGAYPGNMKPNLMFRKQKRNF
ncbi:unnamed protein product [Auanema sp. JU1783]|nr:unnamed protein product [Auanema sp. JU1783]